MKGLDLSQREQRLLRWCSAFWCAALCACLIYALDRSRAALFDLPEDPLLVVKSARVSLFWRVYLSIFLGSALGLAWGWLMPQSRLQRGLDTLLRVTPWCVALCVLASVVLP